MKVDETNFVTFPIASLNVRFDPADYLKMTNGTSHFKEPLSPLFNGSRKSFEMDLSKNLAKEQLDRLAANFGCEVKYSDFPKVFISILTRSYRIDHFGKQVHSRLVHRRDKKLKNLLEETCFENRRISFSSTLLEPGNYLFKTIFWHFCMRIMKVNASFSKVI